MFMIFPGVIVFELELYIIYVAFGFAIILAGGSSPGPSRWTNPTCPYPNAANFSRIACANLAMRP
jgi:hypothetical protein